MNNKYILSLLIASIVPILFWLGGYDFNERGYWAVLCFIFTLAVYLVVLTDPFWSKNK